MNTADTDNMVVIYYGPGMDQPEIIAGKGATVITVDDRRPGYTMVLRNMTALPTEDMAKLLEEMKDGDISISSLLAALYAKLEAAGLEATVTIGDARDVQAA